MIRTMKYLSMLAGGLLLCGTFAGCVREEPVVPGSGDDRFFPDAAGERSAQQKTARKH